MEAEEVFLGFLEQSLRIFLVRFRTSKELTDYLQQFPAEVGKKKDLYTFGKSPDIVCRIGEITSCSNNLAALEFRGKTEGIITLYPPGLVEYLLQRNKSELRAKDRTRLNKALRDRFPAVVGRISGGEKNLTWQFDLPGDAMLQKGSCPGAVRMPKDSLTFWFFCSSSAEFFRHLSAWGIGASPPEWFRQEKYLLSVHSESGGVIFSGMKNVESEKKRRLPKANARRFFRKYKKGDYLIYEVAFRKQKVLIAFQGDQVLLLSSPDMLDKLAAGTVKVNLPSSYFHFQTVLREGISERLDDQFLLQLVPGCDALTADVNGSEAVVKFSCD